MKNGDMPAMAQPNEYRSRLELYLMEDETVGAPPTEGTGLTKREWFAGMALQGILASGALNKYEDLDAAAHYASIDAAVAADAMIEELNRVEE